MSVTVCMEMPRRLAASRSTSTSMRRPPSCASEATSRSIGFVRRRAANLSDHSMTSFESAAVSVYWYCARLARVLIWISCTVWKKTFIPGIVATNRCKRATISPADALRSPRGRKVITSQPAFGVELSLLTPMMDTRPTTSGSFLTASSTSSCRCCICSNETSVPASVTAVISPVSCGGRKPFGMTI